MHRRGFLSTLAAVTAACGRRPVAPAAAPPPRAAAAPAPAPPIEHSIEVLDWAFPAEFGGEKRCVVLVPKPLPAGVKLPVLVALHGLGETTDPITGANAWLKAYELDRSYVRLFSPPLEPVAFQGFVTSERLTEINDDLAARPFGGLIVACPYLPKEIGGPVPIELYARWLGDRLLPKIRAELPADPSVKATGIDGVSLGGWAAIRIAMARPDLFGAVGALQPALIDAGMVEWATALIAEKLGKRPLRIVTSTEDLYRYTLTELDKRLRAKSIAHEFAITPGPHDYPWNKGPGGIEMLLWHDRVLRA
ncbi:MAG: alpha/beta hydrolase [Polyangiales bacterium]